MDSYSTLEAMRKQEESFYVVRGDYLCPSQSVELAVDYGNRESMAEWSYKVIDFLSFHHETVEIAMNFFDRYLLTPAGSEALGCSKLFQLANMACLYLSIKIHEDVVLDSKFMANLSNGLFTYDQVERMELHVLAALNWHVHPPTVLAFVREYLNLLPPSVSQSMKDKTVALCEAQIQVAVMDYAFLNARASTVGIFSVMNALKILGMDSVLLSHVGSLLSYASKIDHESIREDLQRALNDAIVDYSELYGETNQGASCGVSLTQTKYISERASFNESPCGVFS